MRMLPAALLLIVSLALGGPARAWGPLGHRVTGAIAEHYLSADARAAVMGILGVEDLAEASTWPDDMRSNPDVFWRVTASPWHYVTVPAGKVYSEVGAPPEGDAVTALRSFAATLRDPKSTQEQKALALRFAVHVIGDLQQPLHAGNGTDKGGNDVKLSWFGRETNLHALWDSGLPDQKGLSYSEYAGWLLRRIGPEEQRQWSGADPLQWIGESAALRDQIYPKDGKPGYDYIYAWSSTVDRRLTQGGLRIAAWLNQVYATGAR